MSLSDSTQPSNYVIGYMTLNEFCDKTRIIPITARKLIRRQQIPCMRINQLIRIPLDWLVNPNRPEYLHMMRNPVDITKPAKVKPPAA